MSGMLDIPFTQFKLMCTAVGLYKLPAECGECMHQQREPKSHDCAVNDAQNSPFHTCFNQ